MNVPDDWGNYWRRCRRCGRRYHESDGGCDCYVEAEERRDERADRLLAAERDPCIGCQLEDDIGCDGCPAEHLSKCFYCDDNVVADDRALRSVNRDVVAVCCECLNNGVK